MRFAAAAADVNISCVHCRGPQTRAMNEKADNDAETKRRQGDTIIYGQIVRLYHALSRRFVKVSSRQTSVQDPSSMRIELRRPEESHESAWFRIMPRFKVCHFLSFSLPPFYSLAAFSCRGRRRSQHFRVFGAWLGARRGRPCAPGGPDRAGELQGARSGTFPNAGGRTALF